MPYSAGETEQGCLRVFNSRGPAPQNHDPPRGYMPLEKPWNREQAGENCPWDLESR